MSNIIRPKDFYAQPDLSWLKQFKWIFYYLNIMLLKRQSANFR